MVEGSCGEVPYCEILVTNFKWHPVKYEGGQKSHRISFSVVRDLSFGNCSVFNSQGAHAFLVILEPRFVLFRSVCK